MADATEHPQFQSETVSYISIAELHPFSNHPFKVRDDDAMKELVESVREYGVLIPAIARSRADGGYELVSGHRRKQACKLVELDTMPVIVRELDDDTAIIFMVDSNLQREEILPSERAQAYKMKLDAIRRKAGRPSKENFGQVGQNFQNFNSRDLLAEKSEDSSRQIQRYIRLTELKPELQQMVDDKKLAMTPAVELSYLKPEEQAMLMEAIGGKAVPSLAQAQQMKKLSQTTGLNVGNIQSIMKGEKKVKKDASAAKKTKTEPPSSAPEVLNISTMPPTEKPTPVESPAEKAPPPIPYSQEPKQFATLKESIADLKDPNKDCSCTPDSFLMELAAFVDKYHREIAWYHHPYYTVVYPDLQPVQVDYIRERLASINTATDELLHQIEGEEVQNE